MGVIIIYKDKGKIIFQFKYISLSKRNRGYDPRVHKYNIIINIQDIKNIMELIDKNNLAEIILKIIILVYSAKKIIANHPPIYSTLKPETNSDSPSAKSNGLRLTSAMQAIIHIINIIEKPVEKGIGF